MTQLQRKILCFVSYCVVFFLLTFNGAGWWSLLLVPYGVLEYWDGMKTGEEIWCK